MKVFSPTHSHRSVREMVSDTLTDVYGGMVQTGECLKNTQTVHKLRGYLSSAWSVMRISTAPLYSHILTKLSILKCTTLFFGGLVCQQLSYFLVNWIPCEGKR